ncbi:MAG: hypothetical protein A2X22_02935 [Bacteroidetes bacterium GWF2_49_14]|nr:MAG: hypothetical protein A2X22_02935 [Bacteroidetes bacterium GWF2_49_14]
MENQVLKDKHGHKIGEIKEQSGKLVIYDSHGHKKGHYDPKTNTTHDDHGHKTGSGNLLTALI